MENFLEERGVGSVERIDACDGLEVEGRAIQTVNPMANREIPANRASKRLRVLSQAVLVVGIIVTLAGWNLSANRQRQAARAEFDARADQLAGAVSREVGLFVSVLQSLGELHTLSDRISARDFEEFTRKGLRHQADVLGAFAFAQRISLDVRSVLESGADRDALRVTEYGEDGRLRSAALRPEYFPLTYQHPDEALRLPNGFDLATLPGQAAALQRMQETARPALGAMIDAGERSGYLACAPIFTDSTNDTGILSGFTASILWPEEILQRALGRSLAQGIAVALYDPGLVHPPMETNGLLHEAALTVVDQSWRIRCEATPDYEAAHASALPWIILGAGMAMTFLLALQVSSLAARTALVEQTVQQRTAELSAANRQLAEEMDERLRLEQEIHNVTAREKQRIGQDLHDSLGQKLTGAVYLSRALAGALPDDHAEAREHAGKINEILKDAVTQVRRTARGLAPVDVSENGLAQALRRLAEETCDVYNIACSFRAEGPALVRDAQAATHLYHIAQEAVTNALRHGHARDIAIVLRTDDRGGQLFVEDNGQGLAHDYERSGGAGLRIMRHRAQSIGGTIAISERPGGGVRVACEFPLGDSSR